MPKETIRVGLIGLGTVGTGVVQLLQRRAKRLKNELGAEIDVRAVAVRDVSKPRDVELLPGVLTDDALALVRRDDIDVVVELMGGIDDAKRYVIEAIRRQKQIVTANKALIALAGREVFDAAYRHGVGVYFEASVAGGIPIIKSLHEGLAANEILTIHGILNGTCNFILTQMSDLDDSYEQALAKAQELGFAESDPTFDVEGMDTAHKIAILSSLAYGFRVDVDDIFVEGIRDIQPADIRYADELGYVVKLLAISKRRDDGLSIRVHPAMIPAASVLASVKGAFNAVSVVGDAVGPTLFYGQGAGRMPTASAVVADLLSAARTVVGGRPAEIPACWHPERAVSIPAHPIDSCRTRYYLRMQVEDRPGVLAEVATILGRHQISIAAVTQKEPHCENSVPLVLLTHEAQEKDLQRALRQINDLACTREPTVCLRVETGL